MRTITLILFLIASFSHAQYNYDFYALEYSGQHLNLKPDVYNNQVQDGVIIAQKKYNIYDTPRYGRITDSFESTSDYNAVLESSYKSDYQPRINYNYLDEKIGEAIVKGKDGRYYKVDLYKN
jgi:hypothetical protein